MSDWVDKAAEEVVYTLGTGNAPAEVVAAMNTRVAAIIRRHADAELAELREENGMLEADANADCETIANLRQQLADAKRQIVDLQSKPSGYTEAC